MAKSGVLFIVILLCFSASAQVYPGSSWSEVSAGRAGMDNSKLDQAKNYALTGSGSGIITRHGKVVMKWGDQAKLYDIKSSTKSFGATALAICIKDGYCSLDMKAQSLYPDIGKEPSSNTATGWLDDITLFHLATHTSGFDKNGGYTELQFKPGTKWLYSDGAPNWLADCLTYKYKQDLNTLMFNRVFTPIGIKTSDLTWRSNRYRSDTLAGVKRREFGAGISSNVNAMARLGNLYLRDGKWNSQQILPPGFAHTAGTPKSALSDLPIIDPSNEKAHATEHYGILWWNNADGAIPAIPRDAYWSWGLYDSWIVVIPSLDLVVARAGNTIPGDRTPSNYQILAPFITPIVESINKGAPYPNSQSIAGIDWGSTTRQATGSDNWPITWSNDGNLYAAYGDGYGFDPKVPDKLSMGFARIEGNPQSHKGYNIRSSDETTGDGKIGKKASGMLSIGGTLYMLVRNADNNGNYCELWWSTDKAKNWNQASWKFDKLGLCSFVNYGKDTVPGYVYMVSHDNPSSYTYANQFVLLRVPKDKIATQSAWQYFSGTATSPAWSSSYTSRKPIFTQSGKCYRSDMSWDAGLGRFIWWQNKCAQGEDCRSLGKFGVFDAPNPWGPWTTVFYTTNWDMGAGESGHFPPKWMSGNTAYLTFSGDDAFSVRKATFIADSASDCGNGNCDANECNTCSQDCSKAQCVDGTCQPFEDCNDADCACTGGKKCCSGKCVMPACSKNSDCGTSSCMTFTCTNPGTCSASCSSSPVNCGANDGCCPAGCSSDPDCNVCQGMVMLHNYESGATDASGTGNDGSIHGPVSATGKYGKGLSYDGADDYVSVAEDSTLKTTGPMTVAAWIKPDTISSTKEQDRIIAQGSPRNYELTISTGDTGCDSGDGDVQWRLFSNADDRICGGKLALGQWNHVAGTFDGSTMRLYVNGQLAQSYSYAKGSTLNPGPLYTGNRPEMQRAFDGVMDEVAVWARALSAQEISVIASGPITCGCTELSDVINAIESWKSGQGTLEQVMQAIIGWKNGC